MMLAIVVLPSWLVDERYLTLATWGLVVSTLLLVVDSWTKSREQRARWKREDAQHSKDREEERARWLREDEIRLDQLAPKLAFGLELRSRANDLEPINIWCANLGSVAAHIESVSVCRLSDLGKEQADFEFAPHQLANSGEMVHIAIPSVMFRGLQGHVDLEIWCDVASAHKHVTTVREVYSLFVVEGRVSQVRRGFYEDRLVLCAKCESTGFLSPKGVASKAELMEIMDRAAKELSESCPNHSSTVLRSILNADGIRTWSRDLYEGGPGA